MIRRALAWAAGVLAALGAVWAMGRRQGAAAARNEALRQANDDLSTAIEVTREVDAKTDDAVSGDLAKWLRHE